MSLHFTRVLRVLRGDTAAGRAARDVALWLLLLVPSVIWAVDGRLAGSTWFELALPPFALAAVVLAGRRLPLAAFALAVALTVLDPLSPVDRYTLVVVVTAYLLAVRLPGAHTAALGMGVVVPAGMLAGFLLHQQDPAWVWGYSAVALPFVTVFPWLFGRYQSQRRELVYGGWARAEELERSQRHELRQARLRERARIAHDMHDSLGHELSLLTLRAGELELAPDLAEHHRDAVGGLRIGAGNATERLREIIGVLRADAEPPPREPAQDTIANLVERARSSGMKVRLETEGAAADLPPMADRAAYRVVQESLTNAAKHAPGAVVTVRLAYGREETVVTVANPLATRPVTGVSSGDFGLVGLQERVRLAGGTFDAGARDGTFTTIARLPRRAAVGDQTQSAETNPSAIVSLSARKHELALRRARRSFLLAFGVPVSIGLLMVLGATGLVYQTYSSVLAPDDFDRLRVGQSRAELRSTLPVRTLTELPERLSRPPVPPGARCDFYVSTADLFAVDAPLYRLCFTADRLAAKDELTRR
ncbi:Histidine kinase [Actinokineospora alba]|uniref:histidine kinase n=1 Tax=Actinokineospora alba TaxID=504798 RepID=A0A1H0W188_9PSEU|nr:histidine kinase [Actinokineospora alba]TDP67762.1 histidine kinase [Actinokineospora alba]SDI71410.1 Histidine kinase [Actinokineospora alba]SDP84507.1 Histidine kinase [Actinokineospora alba]